VTFIFVPLEKPERTPSGEKIPKAKNGWCGLGLRI